MGKVTITATQPGQAPWQSATASQPFIVTATPRADQTITFVDIADKLVNSSNFDLNATASSGLPVSFTSLHPGVATVESNGTVTIVGAGVATMRATQDGNGSYNPAPSVEKTLTVTKVPQTITFNALSDASLNTGTYSLSGKATASSGLAVSYATSDASVASLSGSTLSLIKGGTVTITASQGGNDTFLAAADATRSLTIKDDRYIDQNISWSQTLSSMTFGAADLSLTARSIDAGTGADTNLTIAYASSDTTVVTIVSGNSLRVVSSGSATITATQTGNVDTGGRYNAATPVTKSVTVGKATQSIITNGANTTLPNLSKDNGDFPFAPGIKSINASGADTGLTLSYSSSNTSVIDVNGINLEPKGVGTATITVSQSGDSSYAAATSKTFTVTVTEKTPYSDSYSDLILWLNGKDLNGDGLSDSTSDFLSGGAVSSWADKSGNANTLTQSTSANQPSWYPATGGLSFDGTHDFLSASMPNALAGNPGLTFLIVADTVSSTNKRLLQFGDNAYGSAKLIAFNTKGTIGYANGGALNGTYDFTATRGIGAWRRTAGDHTGLGDFFSNGEKKGLTASSSASLTLPSSGSSIMLAKGQGGTGWTSPQYFGGKIYEVMLFSSDLSDYNIKRLEGYLAHKWNSANALPSSHPFKSTAPTFGGSQSIVSTGNSVPVVSGTPTLSFDIGKFTLEEYGYYSTSGLPLTYATSNASVLAVDAATGKLDPKGAGTATITISQAGDTHFSAASNVTLSLAITSERSQTITFTTIPDCNTSVSTLNLSATASSGLTVSFTSSDTNVATVSGSTLTVVEAGTVTIEATQAGGTDPGNSSITYSAAAPVTQTFTINPIGDPLTVTLDNIGTKGTGETFTPRTTVLDGKTGKVLNRVPGLTITYTIISGTHASVTGGGKTITTASSGSGNVTLKASAALTGYATTSSNQTFTVDGTNAGQTISFDYSKGLRAKMPLSRKPIPLFAHTTATANGSALAVSFDFDNSNGSGNPGNIAKIDAKGNLLFAQGLTSNPFGDDKSITIKIKAYRDTGNGYWAASVTKEVEIMAPSKSAYFEARKSDDRYDAVKAKAKGRMPAGLADTKAEALFNSDNYDSDGDGISNALERAFGGDSLSNDSRNTLPRPIKSKPSAYSDHEFITFIKYQDSFNTEGIEYIVETSYDLRTWDASGATEHNSENLEGGMKQVVYRSNQGRSDGHDTIFIRVRVKTK